MSLRQQYLQACRHPHVWNPWAAMDRFNEYDRYRQQFAHAIWEWLYGDNPQGFHSLSKLAWHVVWEVNGGGKTIWCLDFSERNQRLYLGDGLLQYLGLLKDEIEATYQKPAGMVVR